MKFWWKIITLSLITALLATGCSWKAKTFAVEPPAVARSTLIYDKNGDVITHFRGEQHRLLVQNLDEIPQIVQNAVIAIEDERFWRHNGIDVRAMARAARSNIRLGGISEGGSTITQQYVGLSFLDRTDRSTSRKLEEVALALQFERLYSKEFILREYLNTVYFGEGAYGIQAAAQEFFGNELNEITLAEAALLAGLIQAPGTFNPYSNPNRSLARRAEVLESMLNQGLITPKEYETARTEPLDLRPRVAVLEETYIAPYFVEEVRQWFLRNPAFGETRQERADLLFEGGLHIYTTLDPEAQKIAEEAITSTLPHIEGIETAANPDSSPQETQEQLASAVVVLENDTGFVRALVGGRDFFGDDPESRFNIATQGGRQAGSAMKPITLAAALEQGREVTDLFHAPQKLDLPIDGLPINWEVEGGTDNNEQISLYEALVSSVNTVYAQLSNDVGPENSVSMGQRLGVERNLEPVLSIALGSEDVSPLDIASVYSTFARRGIKVSPSFITRIAAANGTLLYDHELGGTRVLDRTIADKLTGAMVDVIRRGTGTRAQIAGATIAGKTGTSTNYYDATFAGFSPEFTVSVWVGFPSAQIAMEPPLTPIRVTGGSYPAAIFQKTMSKLKRDPERSFPNAIRIHELEPDTIRFRPNFVRVIDVTELTRKEAVTEITNQNLVAGIVEVLAEDDTDPNLDRVIEQEPGGFRLLAEGEVVTLTIATMPTDCRKFLELLPTSFIGPDLIIGPNGRLQDTLAFNLPVIEANFSVPEDCDDLIAAALADENQPQRTPNNNDTPEDTELSESNTEQIRN